jgi:hypothetical protein
MRKEVMNTYYTGEDIYVTISEPYIQVFFPEEPNGPMLLPYYWGRNFVITNDRVYSSIILEENDEDLAIEKIKEFVNPYITTGEWELNMTVTGHYYYYPLLEGARAGESLSASTGVQDALSLDYPEFEELEEEEEKPSLLETIINFFKNLFGIQ